MSPRLTAGQSVDRVADSISRAADSIEDDLDRRHYADAWREADRLYEIAEAARIAASRQRARVLVRYAREDDRSFAQVGRLLGLTATRAAQVARVGLDAERRRAAELHEREDDAVRLDRSDVDEHHQGDDMVDVDERRPAGE